MKKYRYSYQTIVRYSALVASHQFQLRCSASSDGSQNIIEQNLELLSSAKRHYTSDNFGNTLIYGSVRAPHDIFVVAINGVALCGYYLFVEATPHPMFLAHTSLTASNSEIMLFGDGAPRVGSSIEQALVLCQMLHSKMSYIPGVTTTESSAIDSFSLSAGVCQDYAHLLISLARSRGIHARYVAGLLVGTGQTHAWVEIYSNGAWHGVDPTHNRRIDFGYIKISHGRDAADCSVSRGVYRGTASHTTEVRVMVDEII
ncbi:MAG: transglutaminase family protein [Rikenellaceae bacterium]